MVKANFDAGKSTQAEVLDKKSDSAIFTGLDDGARVKALNRATKDTTAAKTPSTPPTLMDWMKPTGMTCQD